MFIALRGRGFASQARNRDISFTPGFSPVWNDDKKRETVFNGFLF